MKLWKAILLTVGISILTVILCLVSFICSAVIMGIIGFNEEIIVTVSGIICSGISYLMIIGISLWVAIDSRKIELNKYKSGICYGPVILFILCFLWWIVAFPWYLSMRYNIKQGLAELKDEYKQADLNW